MDLLSWICVPKQLTLTSLAAARDVWMRVSHASCNLVASPIRCSLLASAHAPSDRSSCCRPMRSTGRSWAACTTACRASAPPTAEVSSLSSFAASCLCFVLRRAELTVLPFCDLPLPVCSANAADADGARLRRSVSSALRASGCFVCACPSCVCPALAVLCWSHASGARLLCARHCVLPFVSRVAHLLPLLCAAQCARRAGTTPPGTSAPWAIRPASRSRYTHLLFLSSSLSASLPAWACRCFRCRSRTGLAA